MCAYAILIWIFVLQFNSIWGLYAFNDNEITGIKYKKNPPPGGNRCGVCPTYYQKVCAFDHLTNSTFIFDNRCIMDLYNCIEGNEFQVMRYDHCLYFGNFAYVHGYKYEDQDYGEDHFIITNSKKNPDFVRRLAQLEENIFDFS